MKLAAMLAGLLVLVGCGGGGEGAAPAAAKTRNDFAALACDTYAKSQLGEKAYQLDRQVLAASLKDAGDGSSSLHAPIVIEPGRSSESKQTLECSVRFIEGRDEPDVLKMQFIW